MATRRQQTMAKLTRERLVRERRELKQEKKRAAAAQRKAQTGDGVPKFEGEQTFEGEPTFGGEPASEPQSEPVTE
jgi:hypothetical protein